jgi:hypothetical protein
MRSARFVTRPSRPGTHSDGMDVVAVILGIVMFALLLLIVEGIDRV